MENLTLDWKTGIEGLRTMYNEMTEYEKSYVGSDALQVLTTYENRIAELEKAAEVAEGEVNDSDNTDVV